MTSPRPPASLEVSALSHRYPGSATQALAEVSFRVAPGERVGLLGPNGAGKSTLMRLVCGYLPVQAGPRTAVRVGEVDVAADSLRARRRVGYLPEQVPLYVELRVREHLDFRAAIKGVRGKQRPAEIQRVAARTGLAEMLEVPIQQLSRGYRQRVGIADALLGAPPLVVLDEPTVGLDPNQVLEIRAMLRALGGAQTLIFSSHILAEVEALCDRVVILASGRCVADESVAEAMRTAEVQAAWDAAPAAAAAALAAALRALAGDAGAGRLPGSDLSPGTGEFDLSPGTGGADAAGEASDVSRELAGLATAAGVQLAGLTVEDGVIRARLGCPTAAAADALTRAIGRASAEARAPLVRLELGRRRLEERFARVTGAAS
jgi:ABC-2 type transport system ATP-binding protein